MIEYATVSEVGEKQVNEDSVKISMNQSLMAYGFFLADGLGGHGNGDVASKIVVDCFGGEIERASELNDVFIDERFEMAQECLMMEKELRGLPSIKTTLAALIIKENYAQWGHIGDSRIYHFRDGKLLSRTLDHSVPQLLVQSGKIKERDIRHHAERSVLLRAMGTEWDDTQYEIDQRRLKLIKGDTFLLCSDGFWEWIDEKSMLKILKKKSVAYDALREMTTEVKTKGKGKGMDNFSAILVNVK